MSLLSKPAKAAPRVASVTVDTGDFFIAHLSNGGVRIMMRAKIGLDVPATHALYAEIIAQTQATIEGLDPSVICWANAAGESLPVRPLLFWPLDKNCDRLSSAECMALLIDSLRGTP